MKRTATLLAGLLAFLVALPAAAQTGDQQVTGARDFRTAPIVEDGSYTDTILTGETLWFGVFLINDDSKEFDVFTEHLVQGRDDLRLVVDWVGPTLGVVSGGSDEVEASSFYYGGANDGSTWLWYLRFSVQSDSLAIEEVPFRFTIAGAEAYDAEPCDGVASCDLDERAVALQAEVDDLVRRIEAGPPAEATPSTTAPATESAAEEPPAEVVELRSEVEDLEEDLDARRQRSRDLEQEILAVQSAAPVEAPDSSGSSLPALVLYALGAVAAAAGVYLALGRPSIGKGTLLLGGVGVIALVFVLVCTTCPWNSSSGSGHLFGDWSLQYFETRSFEAESGSLVQRDVGVFDLDTGNLIVRSMNDADALVSEVVIVGDFVAVRASADDEWDTGSLADAGISASHAESSLSLGRRSSEDVERPMAGFAVPFDEVYQLTFDAGDAPGSDPPVSANPPSRLAPDSIGANTVWVHDGRIVGEELAYWLEIWADGEPTTVGVIDSTRYLQLHVDWAPDLGTAALAYGWEDAYRLIAELASGSPTAHPETVLALGPIALGGGQPLALSSGAAGAARGGAARFPSGGGAAGAASRARRPGPGSEYLTALESVALFAGGAFGALGDSLFGAIAGGDEASNPPEQEGPPSPENIPPVPEPSTSTSTLPPLDHPAPENCDIVGSLLYWSGLSFQEHHIASDKTKTWSPLFQEMFDGVGIDITKDPINQIRIPHEGRGYVGFRFGHPPEYHKWVYKNLKAAGDDPEKFREVLENLKKWIEADPSIINDVYWLCHRDPDRGFRRPGAGKEAPPALDPDDCSDEWWKP